MRTEAAKSFDQGFLLTEQELRRIHDQLTQQMLRLIPDDKLHHLYEVKFRNGSIAEKDNIDELFSVENYGSSSISRITIYLSDSKKVRDDIAANYSVYISLTFSSEGSSRDTSADDPPVRYRIISEDRDWVFITSSQLDERIQKIKRFRLLGSRNREIVYFCPVIMVIMMITFMIALPRLDRAQAERLETIRAIRSAWRAGNLTDPVDALLAVFEAREGPTNFFTIMIPIFVISLVISIIPIIISSSARYFWPLQNFLWGE